MFPLTYQRLAITGLHWAIVHIAAAGAFGGATELLEFVRDRGWSHQGEWELLWGLSVLALLWLTFQAQSLIVCAAGMPAPHWVGASFGGVAAGFTLGMAVAMFLMVPVFAAGSRLLEQVATSLVLFIAGGIFGGVQSAGYRRTELAHLAWMAACGLTLVLPGVCEDFYGKELRQLGPIVYGSLLGGIFGVVTGACLMCLAPRTREAAQQYCRDVVIEVCDSPAIDVTAHAAQNEAATTTQRRSTP